MTTPAERAAVPADLHRLVDAYRAHEARVYAVCLRYLKDPAAAQDATQDTFIRASAHLEAPAAGKLGAYLASTARNVCLNELGARGRDQRVAGRLGPPDPAIDPEVTVVDRRAISEVWAGLTQRDRVLFLYRFAGYSYDEIARRIGIPVNTVRVSLLRARRRARLLLQSLPALLLPQRRRGHAAGGAGRATSWVVGGAGLGGLLPLVIATPVVAIMVASSAMGSATTPAQLILTGSSATAGVGAASLSGVVVTSLAVVPHQQGTVVAAGYVAGCASSACQVLYRSDDGGTSWRQLPGRGFAGGSVLVPDAVPRDPALFAAGPHGLQRSDDGGASFTVVVPVVGPAAIGSGAAPGDATVVIATAQRLLLYSERSRGVTLGALLPRDSRPLDVRFAEDAGHVLVATKGAQGALLRCEVRTSCSTVLRSEGVSVRLVSSSTVASDHAVAVIAGRRVAVSTTFGRSFASAVFDRDVITAGLATVGGRLQVAVAVAEEHEASLRVSTDGGATYAPPQAAGWLPRPGALAVLQDGRLLAAAEIGDAAGRWGVRWSADGGAAWALAG